MAKPVAHMAAPISANSPVARWYLTTYIINSVAPITVTKDATSVVRVASDDLGGMVAANEGPLYRR